jgi:hypothetical protein
MMHHETAALTIPRRRHDTIGSGFPRGDLAAVLATKIALVVGWRDRRHVAMHLEGFAATEAGSALDMLKAAELESDPKLRRLFFRHALDEARHAQLFRDAARRVHPDGVRAIPDRAVIRATRQNLYKELGLVRFIAFVYLSERRAARQFAAIARRFAADPVIADLFAKVLRDEKFHVAYSGFLLDRWRADGRNAEVRSALLRVRAATAWTAWRRAGRVIGDLVARAMLLLVWALVLPLFALIERRRPRERGWQPGSAGVRSLADAKREG